MKTGHWLGLAIVCCVCFLLGLFSTVAMIETTIKQSVFEAMDYYIESNGAYEEIGNPEK